MVRVDMQDRACERDSKSRKRETDVEFCQKSGRSVKFLFASARRTLSDKGVVRCAMSSPALSAVVSTASSR